jgi:hypothetical protein
MMTSCERNESQYTQIVRIRDAPRRCMRQGQGVSESGRISNGGQAMYIGAGLVTLIVVIALLVLIF